MAINFPGSLDNFTNPTSASPINSPSHADQHANANDAIEALEAKVGVDGSLVSTSHDYKIAQLQSLVTSAVAGAKSIYQDVRNQSGSAFAKATPVYVSGSTGASGQMLISASSNAAEATSSKTMGLTTSAISNNSNGQVISEGILEGIDTTGAADGDPVWLGTNGAKIYGLINKPASPAHLVFLGVVIRGGQANTGSMYVKIQNGFELEELHNVQISSLTNGNILAYDSTAGTWKNTNTLQSTTTTVPLIVKAALNATSNIQEWQNSAGTVLSYITKDGSLDLRNTSNTALAFTNSGTVGPKIDLWGGQYGIGLAIGRAVTFFPFSGGFALRKDAYDGTSVFDVSYAGTTTLTPSASAQGLIVKGAASQTANLSEWQNSSGTVIAAVSSVGVIRSSTFANTTPGLTYISTNYDTSGLGIVIPNAAYKGLIIRGTASQTADLQEWQDSSGTVLARVASDGAFYAGGLSVYANGNTINGNVFSSSYLQSVYTLNVASYSSGPVSQVPLTVNGVTGQTGNLTEWKNSSGSVLAKVDASGIGTFSQAVFGASAAIQNYLSVNPKVSISTATASTPGLIIKAVSSQTANLQEWQNSSGTTITRIAGDAIFRGTMSDVAQVGQLLNTSYSATQVPLIAKGAASQTANLQEWQNSAGTILAKVTSTGMLDITPSSGSTISFRDSGGGLTFWGGNSSYFMNTGLYMTGGSWASGRLGVDTQGASNIGAVIRGAASQTADLQQWQDNAGTVYTSIGSTGRFYSTQRFSINDTSYNAYHTIKSANTSIPTSVVQAAASQTADLQQWQRSDGTTDLRVTNFGTIISNGGTTIASNPTINAYGAAMKIASGINTYPMLIIQGAASQSANIQEWRNSAGTVMGRINSNYILEVYNGIYTYQLGSSDDGTLVALMGSNGDISFAGTVSTAKIKGSASSTISVNTASTVDTVALSSFTTMEYTLSIKQGSKIRSSKVLVHTDGTSVDSTEYGIIEMGGGISGVAISASVSSTNAILQVTITDAATTNATVKLIKTML